jgi:hypothetical protein
MLRDPGKSAEEKYEREWGENTVFLLQYFCEQCPIMAKASW